MYVIVTFPDFTGVSTPLDDPIVATIALLELHVPPVIAFVYVPVLLEHRGLGPEIAGRVVASTVTTFVATQDPPA